MGAWEAMKKSPVFAAATAALSLEFNQLLVYGGTAAQRLAPFRHFVRSNESRLRSIAERTPHLRWILAYLDYIVRTDT